MYAALLQSGGLARRGRRAAFRGGSPVHGGDFTEALRLCRQAETVAALHGHYAIRFAPYFARASGSGAENTSTACAAVREMRDLITKNRIIFCCTRRRSARRAFPASSGVRTKSPRGCTRAGVNACTPSPRAISGWRRAALCCWPGMPPPCSACSTPCCNPSLRQAPPVLHLRPYLLGRRPCHARRAGKGA